MMTQLRIIAGRARTSTPVVTRIKCFSTKNAIDDYLEPCGTKLPADFHFFPSFLDEIEQRILLEAALRKLDITGSRAARRKRDSKCQPMYDAKTPDIDDLFLSGKYYDFEEGHYDGVIMHFREAHVTSWPRNLLLEPVLLRLHSLLPVVAQADIQTHLLHLASNGQILPHVDNIDASGSCIAAVSLGGERILKMESETDRKCFEILLPSGSAYVQRNAIRYSYKHSILPGGREFKGRFVPHSQRVSIMLRDRLFTSLKRNHCYE
ncbi:hypothetical protein K439DRAFT_1403449 [Ramaria rubella]|nr:hypothetical protein K439DRAFT_1403449 [Ramaria rubella]